MVKNRNYIISSTVIAILYWVADSFIEWHVHAGGEFELIPSDYYELWLKTMITMLLICYGFYTNSFTKKIIAKEEEKKLIYKESANEARKILKEFLHDVHYFESEAERIGGFDGKSLQYLEGALKKTENSLDNLVNMRDLTSENFIVTKKK